MGIPGPGPAAGPVPEAGGRRTEPKPAGQAAGAGDVPVPEPEKGRTSPPVSQPFALQINALKLPPDRWSASILSFAAFFSLPLKGNFLNLIRRQVLEMLNRSADPVPGGPGEGNAAGAEKPAEFREALTLAALAARAKGVELSPEALAKYARALLRGLEGDSREDGEAEDRYGRETDTGMETPKAGDRRGRGKGAAEENRAAALKERVLGAGGPLLDLLNKLPGHGGKRWIVLPFSTDGSLECCLRILLVPQTGPALYRAERVGLDIRRREEPGPAWSFVFRMDTAEPAGTPLLEIVCCPARARTEALERKLADLLGLPPESVRFGNGQFPVLAEDSRDWTLFSVNKEV